MCVSCGLACLPHAEQTHALGFSADAHLLSCRVQVREIYEMAVEAEPPYALTDADCKTMCLRYARLEKQARAAPTALA